MPSPAQLAERSRVESPPRPRSSHLDYESFWTTSEEPGWLDRVLDQGAAWLRESLRLDVDLTVDGSVRSPDGTKRVQVLHRQASRSRGTRVRVWNANSGVTFIVTVLAVEDPRGGWLQISVTCDDPYVVAKKPRLADQILDVVEFADVTVLRSQAEYTSRYGLDDLEQLIDSADRRLPVIVAAPLDDVPFDAWNARVGNWTRQTVGLAHVLSLDPNAAEEFESRHGRHAVLPGTLRTYPAGADLSDPVTGRTARWLSHKSLAGDDRMVTETIENFVRQHSASQPVPLPPAAREWARAFARIESGRLRDAVTPTSVRLDERRERFAARKREIPELRPTVPDFHGASRIAAPASSDSASQEIEQLRRELASSQEALRQATQRLDAVQETLMVDDLSEDSLTELLELATRDIPDQAAINTLLETNDALQSRIDGLQGDLDDERSEKSEVRKVLTRLEEDSARDRREIAYLRTKLSENDPQAAYAFTDQGAPKNPLGECPATWERLAESKTLETHGIVLTASTRKIKGLTTIDTDGAALTAAWEAFGTLAAYRTAVQSGSWDRDVHEFCEAGPADAFHVPPNKHSRGETSATKKDTRYKKARHLPVPKSVDSTGKAYMWSHFKPYTWAKEKRLRIHYYDQASTDGKIYVGHVGEHLPSASTTKVHR